MENLTVQQLKKLCQKKKIQTKTYWRKKDYISALEQKNVKKQSTVLKEKVQSTKDKTTIRQLKSELDQVKQKSKRESDLIYDLLYTLNYADHWIHQNLTKPVAQKIQIKLLDPLRKKHPFITRQWDKEQIKQFRQGLKNLDDPLGPFKFSH